MAKGKDGNSGGRGMDDYKADKGKMDAPWFGPGDNSLAKSAPRVSGMDGQKGGVRDGTSGANDKGGAGHTPG